MFEIKQEPKKDMKTVYDYNRRQEIKIFRGQCFNNSALIFSIVPDPSVKSIFDFAEQLYNEGMKRDFLRLEEVKQ